MRTCSKREQPQSCWVISQYIFILQGNRFVCTSGTFSNLIIQSGVHCPYNYYYWFLLFMNNGIFMWIPQSAQFAPLFSRCNHCLRYYMGRKTGNKGMGDVKEREDSIQQNKTKKNNCHAFSSSFKTALSAPVAHLSIAFPLWTTI